MLVVGSDSTASGLVDGLDGRNGTVPAFTVVAFEYTEMDSSSRSLESTLRRRRKPPPPPVLPPLRVRPLFLVIRPLLIWFSLLDVAINVLSDVVATVDVDKDFSGE